MAVDFEAVKKLPAPEQIIEFKKIMSAAEKFTADSKKKLADLEKEEKNEDRDKKIAELKKLIDEAIKDRNSAEQLLARSEIEAKALETVLSQTRAERKEEENTGARQREQLENILSAEKTRDDERKRDERKPEDSYKTSKGYETQSVYEQQNKFYENTNPEKRRDDREPYKTRAERDREQEIIQSTMYSGSESGKAYR